MDHPADSTAKLCQGGKGMYVGREGIPMDDSSGKECEPVIILRVWICLYASEGMCLDALVFRTR